MHAAGHNPPKSTARSLVERQARSQDADLMVLAARGQDSSQDLMMLFLGLCLTLKELVVVLAHRLRRRHLQWLLNNECSAGRTCGP